MIIPHSFQMAPEVRYRVECSATGFTLPNVSLVMSLPVDDPLLDPTQLVSTLSSSLDREYCNSLASPCTIAEITERSKNSIAYALRCDLWCSAAPV
jgi:hypothetical protein